MKLNKGEWSEVYVFLKLLAEGKLYAADKNLNRMPRRYYSVLQIMREDIGKYFKCEGGKVFILNKEGEIYKEHDCEEFTSHSLRLLNSIVNNKAPSFEVADATNFMSKLGISKLKAESQDKRDIIIKVHDSVIGTDEVLGFSIKSNLGGAPTLFNASKSTNFIYKIEGELAPEIVDKINLIDSRSKIRDRIKAIYENNCRLVFEGLNNKIFELNLIMTDSYMPKILSEMLLIYYRGKGPKLADIVKIIEQTNSRNYDLSLEHPFYSRRAKDLISNIALGMTASNVWEGNLKITGGYIVVKSDGDILCYHSYNRNDFEDYLLENTKFDTPSTTKFVFGKIETDLFGNKIFKLNLQIRFL
jgi:type II restriction enzyme